MKLKIKQITVSFNERRMVQEVFGLGEDGGVYVYVPDIGWTLFRPDHQ